MKTKSTKLLLLAGAFFAVQLLSLGGIFADNKAQAAGVNGKIFFVGGKVDFEGIVPPTFDIHNLNPDGSEYTKLTNDDMSNFPSPTMYGETVTMTHGEDQDRARYLNVDGSSGGEITNIDGSTPTMISPNGEKVLYLKNSELHIINIDGSNEVSLGLAPASLSFASIPKWSPDSKAFTFISTDETNIPYVYIANSDGTGLRKLSETPSVGSSFSQDSKRAYFFGLALTEVDGEIVPTMDGLYRINTDGTNQTKLTDVEVPHAAGLMGMVPFVSPDETKLTYLNFNEGSAFESGIFAGDIHSIQLNGSYEDTKIHEDVTFFQFPIILWSPDGTKIAFSKMTDDGSDVDIFTMNPDGSDVKNLTNNADLLEIIMTTTAWTSVKATDTTPPNNGDANDDGVPDSQQPHVTSYKNPKTGKFVTLVSPEGSSIESLVTLDEDDSEVKDEGGFSYPLGLVSFEISGLENGAEAPIELLFHDADEQTASELVARKFSTQSNSVFTIEEADVDEDTVDDQKVLKLSYSVTDGGDLDNDGEANGTIVDPVGLGVNDRLADTGLDQRVMLVAAVPITGVTYFIHRVRKLAYYRLKI